jgi:hypothetical protein
VRHSWGLHLPNGDFDLGRWVDVVGNGTYTLLHMQGNRLPELRRLAPEALVLVRMYLPNWSVVNPTMWAIECSEFYLRNRHLTRHLTWANEQNLADESGGAVGAVNGGRRATEADYQAIHAWNLQFIKDFRARGGADAILHYPAFATGHSDDQHDPQDPGWFVGLEICREGIDECEYLDRHYYPTLDKPVDDPYEGAARVNLARRLYPGKRLFISEFANFRVTDPLTPDHLTKVGYYWQAIPDIDGFTGFIAEDPTRRHQDNDWSRNERLCAAYRETGPHRLAFPPHDQVPPRTPVVVKPGHAEGLDLGPGFAKASRILGPFKDAEVKRFKKSVAWAANANGWAVYDETRNEVVVYNNRTGTILRDGGNAPLAPDGSLQVASTVRAPRQVKAPRSSPRNGKAAT